MPSFFQKALDTLLNRWTMRMVFWLLFFVPLALYSLIGLGQLLDHPPGLDLGVVTVSAALGGLVLNAGVNLTGSKRKETVQVAQKFIAVVLLMIIFLPALHFVVLMNGIDLISFKPDSLEAWVRGFFFWASLPHRTGDGAEWPRLREDAGLNTARWHCPLALRETCGAPERCVYARGSRETTHGAWADRRLLRS